LVSGSERTLKPSPCVADVVVCVVPARRRACASRNERARHPDRARGLPARLPAAHRNRRTCAVVAVMHSNLLRFELAFNLLHRPRGLALLYCPRWLRNIDYRHTRTRAHRSEISGYRARRRSAGRASVASRSRRPSRPTRTRSVTSAIRWTASMALKYARIPPPVLADTLHFTHSLIVGSRRNKARRSSCCLAATTTRVAPSSISRVRSSTATTTRARRTKTLTTTTCSTRSRTRHSRRCRSRPVSRFAAAVTRVNRIDTDSPSTFNRSSRSTSKTRVRLILHCDHSLIHSISSAYLLACLLRLGGDISIQMESFFHSKAVSESVRLALALVGVLRNTESD